MSESKLEVGESKVKLSVGKLKTMPSKPKIKLYINGRSYKIKPTGYYGNYTQFEMSDEEKCSAQRNEILKDCLTLHNIPSCLLDLILSYRKTMEIKWKPFNFSSSLNLCSLQSGNSVEFKWNEEKGEKIPDVLVSEAGPNIECRIVCGKEVICDFGNKVYFGRGGGGCNYSRNCPILLRGSDQEMLMDKFYVGIVVRCVGGVVQKVTFHYDEKKGILKPIEIVCNKNW